MMVTHYDRVPGDAFFGVSHDAASGGLQLAVGTRKAEPAVPAADGACPPMASARFWLRGVGEVSGPEVFDVATLDADVNTFVADLASGGDCPGHAAQTSEHLALGSAALTLTGTLSLSELTCLVETEDAIACPLRAHGSWDLTARDVDGTAVITTTGTFLASDEVF